MAIVTLAEVLSFLDVDNQYFQITAGNNEMIFTSSEAGPRTVTIPDDTYDGDGIAAALQVAMNADATLTGGAITFAVTYSSSTKKFTIDAGIGNTIAYTHSGSDAGFTLGFDSDKSAAQTITSDNPTGDPTDIISTIKTGVEEFVSEYCRRTFESTTYAKEAYSVGQKRVINLYQYPVTTIDRVAIGGRDSISIKNTNSGSSASVSTTSTGLRLVLDGTADETVLFATYATLSAVVTAINSLGNGWVAAVADSTLSSFKSTDLIPVSGQSCINSRLIYLAIIDEARYDFEVDLDRGQIFLPLSGRQVHEGFTEYRGLSTQGRQRRLSRAYIDYIAGYLDSDMPEELKLAVNIIIQTIYERRNDSTWGLEMANVGASGTSGMRQLFDKKNDFPKEALDILGRHKRYMV